MNLTNYSAWPDPGGYQFESEIWAETQLIYVFFSRPPGISLKTVQFPSRRKSLRIAKNGTPLVSSMKYSQTYMKYMVISTGSPRDVRAN